MIDNYLIQKTDELAFITIKNEAELNGIDIEIGEDGLKVPIKNSVLVKGIQENTAENGLNLISIADGMIYMLGIDSDFIYAKKYIEFLREIERKNDFPLINFCGYIARECFDGGELMDALVYLKAAIALMNDDGVLNENILYHYAITAQEISKRYKKDENLKAMNDFMLEALEALEKILDIDDEYAMAYYQLGFHYLNQNQFIKSKLSWEKALELGVDGETDAEIRKLLEQNYHKALYEEGYNLVLNGKAEEGIEILKDLEAQFPDWWNLLFMIGLGYRSLGMINEAIKYYEKILISRPTQVDTLVELGLVYAQTGDMKKAIEYFDKAARIKENPEILCNLGMAYLEVGDIDNASYYIERAYELDPNDEITQACLRELRKFMN